MTSVSDHKDKLHFGAPIASEANKDGGLGERGFNAHSDDTVYVLCTHASTITCNHRAPCYNSHLRLPEVPQGLLHNRDTCDNLLYQLNSHKQMVRLANILMGCTTFARDSMRYYIWSNEQSFDLLRKTVGY